MDDEIENWLREEIRVRRSLQRTLAVGGWLILLYNLIWIIEWNYAFNVFTRGYYLMTGIGSILIISSFQDPDTRIKYPVLAYTKEIIVFGTLLFLIFVIL